MTKAAGGRSRSAARVKLVVVGDGLTPLGRLQIPAGFYDQAAGLAGASRFMSRRREGGITKSCRAARHWAHDIARQFVPEGVSLVDELIAERRREAERRWLRSFSTLRSCSPLSWKSRGTRRFSSSAIRPSLSRESRRGAVTSSRSWLRQEGDRYLHRPVQHAIMRFQFGIGRRIRRSPPVNEVGRPVAGDPACLALRGSVARSH